LFVAASASLDAGAVFAQGTDALTLDDALRIAETRSQELVADDATASAAREMAAAAGEAPDPVLKAGIDNLPVNGPDAYSLTNDFMTMRSVGLSRELTRHDKRDSRAARYVSEAEVAEASRTVALSDLRRRLTANELGQEGFQTSLRLAGSSIGEVKRLDFQRPSRDD
jgi:hypothetical protein